MRPHLVQVTQAAPIQRDRLIRLSETLRIVGVGKSTWYALMKQGKAPRCVQVTPRCVAWSEAACMAWVQDRLNEVGSAGQQTAQTQAQAVNP
jgi:prophage regulatory protein